MITMQIVMNVRVEKIIEIIQACGVTKRRATGAPR